MGRRGYGSRALLGACLVKALYALPTWTRVADLIAEHPGLSDALGGTPSHWACYRFATKVRNERGRIAACLDALAASLREQHPDMGREVAIGASDVRERSAVPLQPRPGAAGVQRPGRILGSPLRRVHAQGRRLLRIQDPRRRVRHHGPAARLGNRDRTPQRIALRRPAARRCTRSRLRARHRGDGPRLRQQPRLRRMPQAPDQPRDPAPQGPHPTGHADQAQHPGVGWLYKRRTSVEREFGRLKHEYGLAFLRVRGIQRVRLHADLVMLGRLSLALARARAVPLAA